MTSNSFNPFAGGVLQRVSPTTGPQKEVIASAQMSDEANTAFNEAASITLNGELDRTQLEQCFLKLIDRHDIFRATFSRSGQEICLHESIPFQLEFEDLRSIGEEEKKRTIQSLWANIAVSPMNLEEGPLLFAWLKQLSDEAHELTIVAHHIVCDGWTFGLILNELSMLYANEDDGLTATESFFDFAEHNAAQDIANKDNDYWQDKFDKVPPVLDLPLDYPRPSTRSFTARRYDYHLSADLVADFPRRAASLKASVVNFVLAGYFTLLHRLTGEEDIVVGLPVAGQSAFNRLNQAGHMVQLLPIRIKITEDTTFTELVTQVKTEVLHASEHPNFTFGKLLEKLVIDRSRVPLISTIFNIDQPIHALKFGDIEGTLSTVPRAAENFEMFLNIIPSPDSFIIETTYSTKLFSEPTVVAWMQSLELILKKVSNNPELKLADVPLAEEIPEVLQQANETKTSISSPDFLSAFRKQCQNTPDAQAVICKKHPLTYDELDQLSDTIAFKLSSNGIKENDIVGLCCERSEKMLACILALFKLGAAYLPLDPDFPQDRLIYMLEDADAAAVIEDDAAPEGILESPTIHFNIYDLSATVDISTPVNTPSPDSGRLAYLIYTSGSTGKPKGVRVQHGAMINFLESMAQQPGASDNERLLAVTTLSFDISVLELFMPLISGGVTILATREESKNGDQLSDLIREHNITQFQATPATWRLLLASDWKTQTTDNQPLKALCGGEPLPPDLAEELLPLVSELWNMFGPTETTVWSTCKKIDDLEGLITVGKPIANTQIYILDNSLSPLPLSAPGELYIGGSGVTLGYHNRKELTDGRFIQHPTFGRIYATGDLAKILPNGEVQHLGRLDNQVKLRGYRIELGEIEAALVNCNGVESAAVYLWELSPEDIRVVACCKTEPSFPLETFAIRKQLRKVLPNYMVPQYLLEVDTIPLTPNGKIDRKNLPRPEIAETTILTQAALQTKTEKLVAAIWSELVKANRTISRDDNFFEIGGHSLLALQAIRRIEVETGKHLTPAEIVSNSLTQLCEKIDIEQETSVEEETEPTPLSNSVLRRLSTEQLRILNRQLSYPDATCNNLPASWVLEGELDIEIMQKSLRRLIERQTALRTIIHTTEGLHHQSLLHPQLIEDVDVNDYSGKLTPLEEALKSVEQLAGVPFDPLNQPLYRLGLYKLAQNKHLLAFVPHQLVFDGWSFDLFLKELEIIYLANKAEVTPKLDALPFEYRDYTHWSVNQAIQPETLNYHQTILNKVKKTESIQKGDCKRKELRFGATALENVEKYCHASDLRLHEYFFSAFALELATSQGTTSTTIGMPVSGRHNPGTIGLIGSFVSTLPCFVDIPQTKGVQTHKAIAQQLSTFLQHQKISYADIINGSDGETQHFPDSMFASFGFQDIRNRPTTLADLTLIQKDISRKQTELPIEFWVRVGPDHFVAIFDYDSNIVSDDIVTNLSEKLKSSIEALGLANLQDASNNHESTFVPKRGPLWRKLFNRKSS